MNVAECCCRGGAHHKLPWQVYLKQYRYLFARCEGGSREIVVVDMTLKNLRLMCFICGLHGMNHSPRFRGTVRRILKRAMVLTAVLTMHQNPIDRSRFVSEACGESHVDRIVLFSATAILGFPPFLRQDKARVFFDF